MKPEMLADVALVAKKRGFRSAGDFVRQLIVFALQGDAEDAAVEADGVHGDGSVGAGMVPGAAIPVEPAKAEGSAPNDVREVNETMATKDIPDVLVCQAVKAANECRFKHWPYDFLEHWTMEPYKVCYRALERAANRGLIEYGSSLRTGWLTEKGKELLKNEVSPKD